VVRTEIITSSMVTAPRMGWPNGVLAARLCAVTAVGNNISRAATINVAAY